MAMDWTNRIGRRLRLKDLHTLQTVAEAGSMAKASQRLALSQPAISKAVSDMEHTLGVALLDRSARGVELTEQGQVMVARTRTIFDEMNQGIKEIAHLADPTQGEVRIGTIEPGAAVLSEIICRLTRRYPRITYQVTVGDTDMLARRLRERALDLMLTRWNALSQADDLAAENLYQSTLVVTADKSHPLMARKRLILADLMEEQWTLPSPDTFLGRVVAELFDRKKLPLPRSVVTTTSTLMRLNLMASGRFLSVLPTTVLRHRSHKAWLRKLNVDLGDSSAPIAAITIKDRRSAGAVKLFLRESRTICKNLSN
jgi:DNA-binding transcriptional LysR family regulator